LATIVDTLLYFFIFQEGKNIIQVLTCSSKGFSTVYPSKE